MGESLKARFAFPNPIIQAQAARSLVASVLKEKGQNGKLSQSSVQGAAVEALWEQCCSGDVGVRATCCHALVLLVEQDHADMDYVLNGILNLLPSAGNVQGLIGALGKILQLQVALRDPETPFHCPYGIRSSPHPYITALENRADCWPALLLEIHRFVQEGTERAEPAFVAMLTPFLRYLYCEPQRQPAHAAFRQNLLRLLLPDHAQQGPAPVRDGLLGCFCQLLPHMQVDSMEAVVELHGCVEVLLPHLLRAAGPSWRAESARLTLLLLCACKQSLQLAGDCSVLLGLVHRLLPACRQEVPVEEVLMGLALLLLEAPADQQTDLLSLALSLFPEDDPVSPWGGPLLLLPALQLLSCAGLVEPLAEPALHRRNLELEARVLRAARRDQRPAPQPCPLLPLPPSPWYSELHAAVGSLRRLAAGGPAAAGEWLASLASALGQRGQRPLPWSLVLVVAHLLAAGPRPVCLLALEASVAIAEADPSKVASLLPLLLFRLEKEREPAVSLAVLYALPKLGTHKFCVPQVLHVLQALAAPNLRAVVMRLMTELWKKQDRVYPELQRVLGQPGSQLSVMAGRDAQWEMVLARAACVKDICRERPYQHGGDMLAAISHTLSHCTKSDLSTPAALVLQGLQDLCQAEVVEMASMWRVLGPRLSCDSRPPVVKAIAELLALVPQLTAKSPEYEKLKEEAVSFLWRYALSKDPEVSSCGYRALAGFPEDAHTILHLPEAARPVSKLPEPDDEEEEQAEKKGEVQEEDLSVPGWSYMSLLRLAPPPALPAYEQLLTSLVRQALRRMPRGVHTLALRGARGSLSDQGKTMAGVPAFMLRAYEKNKQPGLKPGLAVGLLLCYELPVHTDRDGRPIVRFLVSRSRSFQQTLASLIHEVNIQPSEWHRALLLPQAWRAFMSQAFHAVIQGRRAELEMQQKGKDCPEELQHKQHFSWLWARDRLTDVIKSAAKDSPVVQGNCILALSALAAALSKYESDLPTDVDGSLQAAPECIPTAAWLAMATDTLLCIISSGYKAGGQVFPWFLHRSYSGENTASSIARSCAMLGLTLLAPVLVGWHREGVARALSALRARLPGAGGAGADDSQAVQFHSGLALGMLLASLQRQHLSDLSTPVDPGLLSTAQEALEQCAFDPNLEYNTGCVLGLGLLLAILSQSGGGPEGSAARLVLPALDRLVVRLQESGDQGRMLQEVLAYGVACVCVAAFSAGLVDASKADQVMLELRRLTEESQQTPGFSLALGSVVHGLSVCGHGKAADLLPGLLAAWIKILLAEGCPTMQRLSAVSGLVSLVGSESYLIQLKSESEQSSLQQGQLNEVIRTITQIITFSGALGLQSNSACLVGHLHLAHLTTSHSHTSVPQDFAYLPENSILRAIGDFLTQAGKKGPDVYPPVLVKAALAALASAGGGHQYPPVNWSSLLSPLMRLDFREAVQHQCVVLAVSQVQSSQSAAVFLGSWLSRPLVHCLSYPTQAHLYETLGTWMKHVPEDKLQAYVESLAVQRLQGPAAGGQQEEEEEQAAPPLLLLRRSVLRGLAAAMGLPSPPRHCWVLLGSTVEKIYGGLPGSVQDDEVDLYAGVAKCLSEMSDTEIERIARVPEADMEKSCFTLAYLTSQGRLPLLSLNDVISGLLRAGPTAGRAWAGRLLLQTFYQCRLAPGPHTGVSKRMEWLLELMGHIRNVAYGTTSVDRADTKQATDFLLRVFAAAVVAWADHAMPLLLGVRPEGPPRPLAPCSEEGLDACLDACLDALPHGLKQLLDKEPWGGQSQKFLDWLLSIAEGPEQGLSSTAITTARAALQALRSRAEFRKKAVWTRAYGW